MACKRNQHKSWITCNAAMNNRFNFPGTGNGSLNKLDSEGNFLGGLLLSGIKNLNFESYISGTMAKLRAAVCPKCICKIKSSKEVSINHKLVVHFHFTMSSKSVYLFHPHNPRHSWLNPKVRVGISISKTWNDLSEA